MVTAVQTQLFHDHKQGQNESVDEFAQDLCKLYSKAYAGFTKGTPEAEKVGQTYSPVSLWLVFARLFSPRW